MVKQLRAVDYCRTSGEGQRDNTSIPNQQGETRRLIDANGWRFTEHYVDESRSGSKIEGRDDFKRMMRDAAAGKFDVVVIFDVKRFGRDGLDILNSARTLSREFGVHVVDTKGNFDTRDRRKTLTNFIHAGVSEEDRLGILERTNGGKVRRARELNSPLGPLRPHARIWTWKNDKRHAEGGDWSLDTAKVKLIEEAARRYLAGESLETLAELVGLSPSNLYLTLMHNAGDVWVQRVRCPDLDIDETIPTKVPRLLPEETIQAVRQRAALNRTYHRGKPTHKYLLNGFIFCAGCGYALSGQPTKTGRLVYRHTTQKRKHDCPLHPRPWIGADELEQSVMRYLFDELGNPAGVQRAIESVTPSIERASELQRDREKLEAKLAKISKRRARILAYLGEDDEDEEAAAELDKLKAEKEKLSSDLRQLQDSIDSLPTREKIKHASTVIAGKMKRYGNVRLQALKAHANEEFDAATFDDLRALAAEVFAGCTPDGKPNGVYIAPIEGQPAYTRKRYRFRLSGVAAVDGHYVRHLNASSPAKTRSPSVYTAAARCTPPPSPASCRASP